MGEFASELFSSPHENKEEKCYEIERKADRDTTEEDGREVISTINENYEEKENILKNVKAETTERENNELIINQSEEVDNLECKSVNEDCTNCIDVLQQKPTEDDETANSNTEVSLPVVNDNNIQCADLMISREDTSDAQSQHERHPSTIGTETKSKCSNETHVDNMNETVSFILNYQEKPDGNPIVDVNDAEYSPDNENLSYTLQQYLKDDKDDKDEKDVEQDTIYEDYCVISPEELNGLENTPNGDVENDEFTEIELSEIELSEIGLEKLPDDLMSDTSPTPLLTSNESEPIKENGDVTGILKRESIYPGDPEVPSTISVENEPSEVIEQPERACTKISPSGVYINKEKVKFVFPMNNDVCITLRYSNTSKDILGNIRSMKGLGYEEKKPCPEFIRFHVTILPQNEHRTKTKWVHASVRSLAWKFLVGPLKEEEEDAIGKNIRFRLYGKSKFFFLRCYGECFVPLAEVFGAEKSVEFERNILPKGSLKNMNIKCRKRNSTLITRPKNEPQRARGATR